MATAFFGNYRGVANINGTLVLITSGDISANRSRVVEPFRYAPEGGDVTHVILNKGTVEHSGTISFDMTVDSTGTLINYFKELSTSFFFPVKA